MMVVRLLRASVLGAVLLVSVLLLGLVVVCEARATLSVKSFVVYYGSDNVDEVSRFDLAILSPMLSRAVVEELNRRGVVTVGYVSLTTLGGWEPWSANVSEDMVVGRYAEWNEDIVNVSDPRWQLVVLDEAIPYVLGKGFRGVFLDNLDMVDLYPWMNESIVMLVKMIRYKYPDLVIVVNRGFTVIDSIAPYIDAVLFEDFATYYDFTSGRYLKWTGSDYEWMTSIASHLRELREEYGLLVLALGYADLENATMLYEYSVYVNSLAEAYGFVPYVADLTLSKVNPLYPWGAANTTSPTTPATPTTPTTPTPGTATGLNATQPTGSPSPATLIPGGLWLMIIAVLMVALAVAAVALMITRRR